MCSGKKAELLVLAVFWALISVSHVYWLSLDKAPFAWDQAHHLNLAYEYADKLADPFLWPDIFSVAIKYPFLFHLPLGALILWAGLPVSMAAAVNIIWLGLAMIGIWWLGAKILGNWQGVWASLLFALIPASAGLVREVLLETCLAATVIWAVVALFKSQGLTRRGWVLGLGAACGFGLMAKWIFPVMVLGPFLWVICASRGNGKTPDWPALGWGLLICLVICLPWYLHSPVTLVKILISDSWRYGARAGYPAVWSLEGWLMYPQIILKNRCFLFPLCLL